MPQQHLYKGSNIGTRSYINMHKQKVECNLSQQTSANFWLLKFMLQNNTHGTLQKEKRLKDVNKHVEEVKMCHSKASMFNQCKL